MAATLVLDLLQQRYLKLSLVRLVDEVVLLLGSVAEDVRERVIVGAESGARLLDVLCIQIRCQS